MRTNPLVKIIHSLFDISTTPAMPTAIASIIANCALRITNLLLTTKKYRHVSWFKLLRMDHPLHRIYTHSLTDEYVPYMPLDCQKNGRSKTNDREIACT